VACDVECVHRDGGAVQLSHQAGLAVDRALQDRQVGRRTGPAGEEACDLLGTFDRAEHGSDQAAAIAGRRSADPERVALELVEAVLTPNPSGERVPDELYAKASAHYDDKALWTLTLAIAQICFFIPVALIAKPIPGKEPHYSK
jgi:alkylhydroperoxidase family enzyme